MKPQTHETTAQIGGRAITFSTGKLAGQAGGAVTVSLGEALVFAAATMSSTMREGTDFFPLTVDFEERMYAGGRIPGSFFRREGRPSTDAILTARLIDRPLRPLFDGTMRNDVQVIVYAFSADLENPLDVLAINAASAAVTISDIPWNGPVGAVRVGYINGEFVVNPTFEQIDDSELDLRLAGTSDAILMVEAGANEVTEELMVEALAFGHQALQPLIQAQLELAQQAGKAKREVKTFPVDEDMIQRITNRMSSEIEGLLSQPYGKSNLYGGMDEIEEHAVAEFASEDEELKPAVKNAFHEAMRMIVRNRIINQGIRPDGRSPEQIRDIWCEVGLSPRAHGSGLFTRGETQILTLATLGTPKEAQELDNLSPTETKRYMHHYNFPPFSTGEAKPLRGSSRREIGHGALAERALVPVIPPESEFPYTLRLVSEALSSNGSTSMGSVCGSTLALMDTGVPIKAPVAGAAMGLIKEGDRYVVLSDILGTEDHLGDMDFKVAGTDQGITALQMDIKIRGITTDIMREALAKAKDARIHILGKMLEAISAPRPELKPHVPRITTIKIPVDKIGAIIGPGGKIIRALQEETKTKIDIDDDGTVFIAATNAEQEAAVRERILLLTEVAEVGRIYTGRVVRTTDFGAFIQILPNIDGMVHISQLDTERVNSVEDVVQVGDEVTVMVTAIDENGKIRLSRQAVLEGWTPEEALAHDQPRRPSGGGGDRGGRPGGDRGGRPGGGDRGRSGGGDRGRSGGGGDRRR
jgi:polyribonucleotide nucleotidyltransferase